MDNMFQSDNIDNIDSYNGLDTLEKVTFYQCDENNNNIKHKVSYCLENELDGKMFDSVLISNHKMNNNENNHIYDIDNNLLYSQYFYTCNFKVKYVFNSKTFIFELGVIFLIHYILCVSNYMFNIITTDGIISSLIFYLETNNNRILSSNRLTTIDRYIYYLFIVILYYILDYVFWYRYTNIWIYATYIIICPNIMCQIYNTIVYKKIRKVIYNGYNILICKIICRQLCKIINIIIKNVMEVNETITYIELLPYYEKFDFELINNFISTFISACIFNHIDKGNVKCLMILYKNIYMKDNICECRDDKIYIMNIIKKRKWNKLLDIYTLNRILRILFNNDSKKSPLSEHITYIIDNIIFSINRVMLCWTVMGISNLRLGILSFLLFISTTKNPLRYILTVCMFFGLSYMTNEKILVLIFCELLFPIMNSKVLPDIINDTYISIKKGILHIYNVTRMESFILSLYLSYMSYIEYNYIGILTVCFLNLFILPKLIYYNFNNHNKTLNVNSNIFKGDEKIKNINNTDILLILKDRFLILLKSNPLINIINPFVTIHYKILYKLLLQLFFILIFGYLSLFNVKHIILLPFIIQYYLDIVI